MSLVFNMVGGGGDGGLLPTDAILRVQAPAGSTVTITKGTVTKTDLGHENADDHTVYDYYFIIHQSQFDSVNPWTVTATDGVDTATDTVIIDSADEYDIVLEYNLYLYHNGVIDSGISGGLESSITTGSGTQSLTNVNNQLVAYAHYTSGNGTQVRFGTVNSINLADYSRLVIVVDSKEGASGNALVGLYSSKGGDIGASVAHTDIAASTTSQRTYTLDVSSITTSYYVDVRVYVGSGSAATQTIKISDWYLER